MPDNKCETELPPLRELGDGHHSLCWLDDSELAKMEPVISFAARTEENEAPAADGGEEDRPPSVSKPAKPDDLKLISGVGPALEKKLNALGVYTYAQIAKWTKAEREWVDDHLNFRGRIERDDWVRQAQALAEGGEAEYIKVFGKKPR